MARPVFLSYSWDDMGEVDDVDGLLRLRGVPVWRDRRQMRWGGYNEDLARQVIHGQASGFALYLTPAAIEGSWFVREVELPAMDERRSRNAPFFSGAIFRGYGFEAGKAAVFDASGIDIGSTLGSVIDENELANGLRAASNAILMAYLYSEWSEGDMTVRMETRDLIPVEESSLLHLSLSPPLIHDPDAYDFAVWDDAIQPGFADLQQALHTVQTASGVRRRVIEIEGAAHLSAALALGYAFRETTRWNLRMHHHGEVWETSRQAGNLTEWECSTHAGTNPDGAMDVMVHVTADVTNAVRASAGGPARAELHFRPPGGPGKLSLDPREANSVAAGIATKIREARQKYAPEETRLYLASPWPFAALLGWHLASAGPVVMHEATVDRGAYRVSCVLR